MKKKIRAMNKIAMSGLGLGAMATTGTAMGSPMVGNLTNGYGSMMGATGSILGAGMTIDAAKMLQGKKRRKK